MSLRYTHYLLPVPEAMRFSPEPEAVDDLVRRLVAVGWVDPNTARYDVVVDMSPPSPTTLPAVGLAANLRTLFASAASVALALPVATPSETTDLLFWQLPVGTPLGPAQCQEIELLYCGPLAMVAPDGVSGSRLPCPRCGKNLADLAVPTLRGAVPDADSLLASCPSCGDPLQLPALVGSSPSGIDGTDKSEVAPFFRFAVCLMTDAPPEDPAVTDPVMEQLLGDWAGVSFRCMSRWS